MKFAVVISRAISGIQAPEIRLKPMSPMLATIYRGGLTGNRIRESGNACAVPLLIPV